MVENTTLSRDGIERSLDRVTDVLGNEQRRELLRVIEDDGEPLELKEVAERITDGEEQNRVYVALQHSHIPKMDNRGVVDYNRSRNTIDVGENFQETKSALENLESLFR